MAEGYVYILVNQYVPMLVKIGYTDRDPSTRAAELSNTTGVPGKWKVHTSWLLEDAYSCEQKIFASLVRYRETGEFFRFSSDTAVEKVSALLASWGAVDIDGLSAPARQEAKRIQLEEAARDEARYAAQRAAHEETRRREVLKKWDEEKDAIWKQACQQAESQYGESLESIRKSGVHFGVLLFALACLFTGFLLLPVLVILSAITKINLFTLFESRKTKDADRRLGEWLAIRNNLFKEARRIFFQSKNIKNPFDDSKPV